jgi:DNA-binding transcriptional MocR family regulator
MIDLTGAFPPWPHPAVMRFARAQTHASRDRDVWRSRPRRGDPRLRSALARALDLDPEHLVIVAGVRAVLPSLVRAERVIEVERPTFADVPRLCGELGARVRLASWPEMAMRGPGCVHWITSPYRNPDGSTLGSALEARLKDAADRGDWVVQNEIYRWYAQQPRRVPGALLVGSLGKLAGPGAGLGYAWHPSFASLSGPMRAATAVPAPWQRAWAYFIEDDGLGLLHAAIVGRALATSHAFCETLERSTGRQWGAAGPHLLLGVQSPYTEPSAVRLLASAGLAVGEGANFHSPIPSVRLSFSSVTLVGAATAARRCARLHECRVIEPSPPPRH